VATAALDFAASAHAAFDRDRWDRDGAKVLRVALATPLAMVVARGFGLPFDYLSSVLVLAMMPGMAVRPPLKLLAVLVIAVVAFSSGLVWLMTPLLASTPIYLTGLGVLLYLLFRLQGHPRLGPIAALGLPLLVALSPLIPLSLQYTRGLAALLGVLALIAVGATLLAWVVFPGPATAPAAPPAPAARRSAVDAAISAAIMLALIGATLALNAQTALRMLMIACSVLSISDARQSEQRAVMTIGATFAGVLAAWLLTGLMALAASITMAVLLASLVPLLIGRRLADPEDGPFWFAALTAMWVLLGLNGNVAVPKLLSFTVLTLGGVAIAVGVRHTLLWHFDHRVRAP
jgi:hypothetical protein